MAARLVTCTSSRCSGATMPEIHGKCRDCHRLNTDANAEVCPSCGGNLGDYTPVSDVSDSIETLVEQASVPNLAALFGAAKKAGHIKAAYSYGGPSS